jgi:hypothetical protein
MLVAVADEATGKRWLYSLDDLMKALKLSVIDWKLLGDRAWVLAQLRGAA